MACNLTADPSGTVDFLTGTGALIKVIAENDSSTVRITAATVNGKPVGVSGGAVLFSTIAGRNLLSLALAAADPTEQYRIKEECSEGNANLMATGQLQDGPTRSFRIHAF